jgi:CRP-like cAMP-binding protein
MSKNRDLKETTAVLAGTDLFDGLTQAQLELIAYLCEWQEVQMGQILLREGERSDELYLIARGGVAVILDSTTTADPGGPGVASTFLAELREEQVFGEVALVDQGMRSATVQATHEGTLLLRLSGKRLMRLCDTYPELGYRIMRNLAADLALRIRQTDMALQEYRQKG